MALTTAHYETAGGHFIHGIGITPDVVVEIPEEELEALYERMDEEGVNLDDHQLRKALEVLSELMSARDESGRLGACICFRGVKSFNSSLNRFRCFCDKANCWLSYRRVVARAHAVQAHSGIERRMFGVPLKRPIAKHGRRLSASAARGLVGDVFVCRS